MKFRLCGTALLVSLGIASTQAAEESPIEGFTEPWAEIDLAASDLGTIQKIHVSEGDFVREGQQIAGMDDVVLQAALQVALAGMQARGALDSARADLETRSTELNKLRELQSRNHASQREVDRVAGDVRIAEARVQAVRDDLEIKRLECERIRAQLEQRQVRATIDGIVTEIYRDEGEFVSPSQPVVARIVQLDPLQVVFSVPISHRSVLNSGQDVTVQIGAAAEPATAKVEFISPTADASSGTIRVKVRLPNPDGHWHAGDRTVLMLGPSPDSSAEPRSQQLAQRPE